MWLWGRTAAKIGTHVFPFRSVKSTIHGRAPCADLSSGQSSGHEVVHADVQHWYVGAKVSGALSVSDLTEAKPTRSISANVPTAATTAKSATTARLRGPAKNGDCFIPLRVRAR